MKQEWFFKSLKGSETHLSKRYASTKEMFEAIIAFGDAVRGYDIRFYNVIIDDKGGQMLHDGL